MFRNCTQAEGLEGALEAIRERLTLTTSEGQRVQAIGTQLVESLKGDWPVKRGMLTGSIARGTAPSPIGRASLALVIEPGPRGEIYRQSPAGATRALDDLDTALKALKGEGKTLRRRSSILLEGEALPLRLLPVFEDAQGGMFLADGEAGAWRPCHLGQQLAFLIAEEARLKGRAKGILLLLNAWQRHHGFALHSYHLETMALNAFVTPPSGLAAGLLHTLQKLPRAIFEPCMDPTQEGVRLDAYLDAQPGLRDEVAHAAYNAALNMARAIDLNLPGASGEWSKALAREVLGMALGKSSPRGEPPPPPSSP